jgi:hypothetical protein
MKKITFFLLFAFICGIFAYSQQSKSFSEAPKNTFRGEISDSKNQVLINDVPSYLWYRGCGPTALGMVVGYYDIHGFNDLVTGEANLQTEFVNEIIANQEHYVDYSLPLDFYPDLLSDSSELGNPHVSNCIADFMKTSQSLHNNYWGWSWASDIGLAFLNFVQMKNPFYSVTINYEYYNSNSWGIFVNEIDQNRPVVLLVDTDGDGNTDHFVTGIGYDDVNFLYAIYDTWDNQIHWYEWRQMSSMYSWGIYGFNIFSLNRNDVPLVYIEEASEITTTSCVLNATIADDFESPVTESGIIVSTESNLLTTSPGITKIQTDPTISIGEFSFDLENLTPGTKYYYRAYSINDNGTGYSDERSFNTECTIVQSFPYVEDFENLFELPICFYQEIYQETMLIGH